MADGIIISAALLRLHSPSGKQLWCSCGEVRIEMRTSLLTVVLLGVFAVVGVNRMSAQITPRHHLFTELLSTYVHDGIVNYNEMRSDKGLAEYVARLATFNPETLPNEKEKLAFWINAYNAYTLRVICDNYPIESINDLHSGGLIIGSIFKTTVWDKGLVTVGGKTISLNTIEHEIIHPVFKDARAHFALVCASKSCPPLRSEAYEAEILDWQLDDQGRAFLSDPFRNEFDPMKKRAELSKIFSWYESDFGSSEEAVLRYVARFLPDSISRQILTNPGEWKINYKSYDWSLNGN